MNEATIQPAARADRGWLRAVAEFLQRDWILSSANEYVRNPAGVLILAAGVSLMCGFFLHPRGLALSGALVLVLALGCFWPWLSIRGLKGKLRFERQRVREGEPARVRLEIRNAWWWNCWAVSVRKGFRQDGKEDLELGVPKVARRRETNVEWVFTPVCRGLYPVDVPLLATGFPFGVREAKRPLEVDGPLIVWPKTFSLDPAAETESGRGREGRVFRNKPGTAGDFLGVRPYRRGDSLRKIHWPQTARQDRLVVCELQSQAASAIQLVLDLDAAIHGGKGVDGSREWSIRIAASIAETWLAWGAPVTTVLGQVVLQSETTERARTALFDAFAKLPVAGPTLAEVLASSPCRRWDEGLQIVVTTDLALAALGASRAHDRWRRFLVLDAGAFAGRPQPLQLPFRPWIRVDDPNRVVQQVRAGWRGTHVDE